LLILINLNILINIKGGSIDFKMRIMYKSNTKTTKEENSSADGSAIIKNALKILI